MEPNNFFSPFTSFNQLWRWRQRQHLFGVRNAAPGFGHEIHQLFKHRLQARDAACQLPLLQGRNHDPQKSLERDDVPTCGII